MIGNEKKVGNTWINQFPLINSDHNPVYTEVKLGNEIDIKIDKPENEILKRNRQIQKIINKMKKEDWENWQEKVDHHIQEKEENWKSLLNKSRETFFLKKKTRPLFFFSSVFLYSLLHFFI